MLHIALHDGFEDDVVTVRVNGKEVLRREGVTSDPRIGLAHSFEVDVDEAQVTVEVALPARNVAESVVLERGGETNVAASYQDGTIRFRVSDTPFGYV